MAFTVSRMGGGVREGEFRAYGRLLRQRGIDLSRVPRTPEPGTGRRWLPVWNQLEDAENFAAEMRKRTLDKTWTVIEVPPGDEGPLSPLIIQVGRRPSGLVFELEPHSRKIIESLYPDTRLLANIITINFLTYEEAIAAQGFISTLAAEVVPTLTRLQPEQLSRLGYAITEEGDLGTLLFVAPGDLVQLRSSA